MDDILTPEMQEHLARVKQEFRARCQTNVDDINYRCSYGGESFSKYKECFDASKEYLRNGTFITNSKEH